MSSKNQLDDPVEKQKLTENDDFGPLGHELLIAVLRKHCALILSFHRATSHIRDEQIVDSLQKNVISFRKFIKSSLLYLHLLSVHNVPCLEYHFHRKLSWIWTLFWENLPRNNSINSRRNKRCTNSNMQSVHCVCTNSRRTHSLSMTQ